MFLRKLGSIFDHFVNFIYYLGCAFLIGMWGIVCAELFMRSVLNRPIIWATEIVEYMLLYVTFLATAWLLREGAHVKIELVLDRLNIKPRLLI